MQSDDETIRMLDELPQEEPPADLRENVMRAVRGQGAARTGGAPRRRVFAYLWAAAAAAVLLFLVLTPRANVEPEDATAAMASVVTRYESDKATLVVRRRGDFLTVTPIVEDAGPVSIGWDPKSAALVVISGAADASSGKDQTTFTVRDPSQRVAVTLRTLSETASTPVRVSLGNEEVIRAEVPLQ